MPPLRVTCALIKRDDQVLVAQRPEGKALASKWEFPGGKIDDGESPGACLVREIREELGCEIEVGNKLTPVLHPYPKGEIELIPFRCAVKTGEPKALEHTAIRWFDPEQLRELDFAETDRPILDEFLDQRKTS